MSATLLRPREFFVKRARTCRNSAAVCRAVSLRVRRAIALTRHAQAPRTMASRPSRASRASQPKYDDGQSDDGSEFEKESSCARGVPSRGDAIDARRLRE